MAETNYISSIKTSDGKTYNIKDTDARKRMIETTWSNLKTLRDNSQLIAGMQYRITDYQCTTTQADTKSADHQFDIIVTADSTNKLNEEARATLHSGDTYFKDCKLEAWKIWYSLDNNTNRFLWADTTNGKGVIYRMIDEYNNDVAYDFKNIQYKRYKITKAKTSNTENSILVGDYSTADIDRLTVDTTSFIWCYTFTKYYNGTVYDATVVPNTPVSEYIINSSNSKVNHFHGVVGNIVKLYITSVIIDEKYDIPVRELNNIVFFGYKGLGSGENKTNDGFPDCGYAEFLYNTVDYQCNDITFQNECCGNNIIYCYFEYFAYNTSGKTVGWKDI